MHYFLANYVPKIPDYANFKQKFLLFQFHKLANPLWFYSEYKFIHFQSENTEEKVVLPPNKSKRSAFFFFFQAVIGYISSNHGTCYVKN